MTEVPPVTGRRRPGRQRRRRRRSHRRADPAGREALDRADRAGQPRAVPGVLRPHRGAAAQPGAGDRRARPQGRRARLGDRHRRGGGDDLQPGRRGAVGPHHQPVRAAAPVDRVRRAGRCRRAGAAGRPVHHRGGHHRLVPGTGGPERHAGQRHRGRAGPCPGGAAGPGVGLDRPPADGRRGAGRGAGDRGRHRQRRLCADRGGGAGVRPALRAHHARPAAATRAPGRPSRGAPSPARSG